ncbi:hypothetical protein EUGRSUZ_H01862 [Eucalyptus grandis]|uniref:Uncharacterized protein n=2 Tax=Eucalyptus grandis TaxID=71139 RepID=A0ACC3M085_EUCGR|nr:hypothetical protein EUGRSUZ_H01862 [Eucalyptus grandis]
MQTKSTVKFIMKTFNDSLLQRTWKRLRAKCYRRRSDRAEASLNSSASKEGNASIKLRTISRKFANAVNQGGEDKIEDILSETLTWI